MNSQDAAARERASMEKRNLALNLVVYVVMNAVFVAGWAPNAGQPIPAGFPWPIIPIVAWGAGLLAYGLRVYRRTN